MIVPPEIPKEILVLSHDPENVLYNGLPIASQHG